MKSWARLQQSVALSSAESELYALTEGARESMGLRCAIGHVTGFQPESQHVPTIFCDSEAAINVSKMEGLRKLRHIDLRACFIQHEVQSGSIVVKPVKGKDNPADVFTKCLDGPSTLRHMASLGLQEVQLRKGSACAVGLLKILCRKGSGYPWLTG